MALHLPCPAIAPGLVDSVHVGLFYDLRLSLWDQTEGFVNEVLSYILNYSLGLMSQGACANLSHIQCALSRNSHARSCRLGFTGALVLIRSPQLHQCGRLAN